MCFCGLTCQRGSSVWTTFTNRSSYVRRRQTEGGEGIEGVKEDGGEEKQLRGDGGVKSAEQQMERGINSREEDELSVSKSLLCTRKRRAQRSAAQRGKKKKKLLLLHVWTPTRQQWTSHHNSWSRPLIPSLWIIMRLLVDTSSVFWSFHSLRDQRHWKKYWG